MFFFNIVFQTTGSVLRMLSDQLTANVLRMKYDVEMPWSSQSSSTYHAKMSALFYLTSTNST